MGSQPPLDMRNRAIPLHFTDNESRTYMIGLLIQDNAYEQDIRELLMSFYPGETYAHEVRDELWFYVETRLGQGEISVLIWDRDGGGDGGRNGLDQGCLTTQQPRMWLRRCSIRCLWSAREPGFPGVPLQESVPPRLPLPGWRKAGAGTIYAPS